MHNIGIVYLLAGIMTGIFVASSKEVRVAFNGNQVPAARLVGGIMAGVLWPAVWFQYILG